MKIFLTFLAIFGAPVAASPAPPPQAADVIIYGATPNGIVTAVRAGREGLKVVLVSAYPHIGGIVSNGLGVFDTLYQGSRAPLFDEVRSRITGGSDKFHGYEPHAAEKAFEDLIAAEKNITVLRGYYPEQADRNGRQIVSVQFHAMEGDERFTAAAPAFVDASYEGDLAAISGARMTVGRESKDQYGEAHAGRIFMKVVPIPRPSAYQSEGLKLKEFRLTNTPAMPGSTGEADNAVQAYNFRVCVTNDPADRRPVEKPEHWDAGLEADMRALLKKGRWGFGADAPGKKGSWNAPILIGENFAYPTGNWTVRRAIIQRHRDFALGYLWFLQNDPSVPASIRKQALEWGLPKDEFLDNGGFPHEMYVREGRRLVGRYVFTENDAVKAPGLARAPVHGDSIAFTEWPLDAHSCHLETVDDSDYEGKVLLSEETRPAQIPYRILLPAEFDNLLVTGCVSASHVGWGAVRLEPTWMHLAESAGYALALAHRHGLAPADLAMDELQRLLVQKGISLNFFNDLSLTGGSTSPQIAAAQYFAAKGYFATYNARLDEPLTPALAQIWAQPDSDPAVTVKRAASAEKQSGEITAEKFAALTGKTWANPPPGPLSRGQACAWLFSLAPSKE